LGIILLKVLYSAFLMLPCYVLSVCLYACVVTTLYILVTIDNLTVMYIVCVHCCFTSVAIQMLVAECCKYITTRKNWSREFI